MTGVEPGPRGQDAAAVVIQGDVNCDAAVNAVDSLQILRSVAGLSTSANCLDDAGDVDCSGAINSVDALRILRYVAGLNVQTPDGCTPIGDALGPISPQVLAARLAEEITTGTVVDAVEGVRQVLARGGVATGDLTETLVAAEEPAPGTVSLPLESLVLGLEARHRETLFRMTAAELGQMLADFGWPFSTESTSGEQIVALLGVWVQGAQQLPDDPVSFGPLFLQQMANRQDPPVDLAAGDAAPEDVHFSLLELDVFTALLDRLTIRPEAGPEARAAAAFDPCSDVKKAISGVASPFGGQVYGLITSQAGPAYVEEGLQAAGVSAETAGDFGTALGALSIAAKIWKLIAFYANEQVEVTSSNDTVHKPLVDGSKYVLFTARAGVSEEDWQEYQDKLGGELGAEIASAMKHCLNEYGLSTFADLGEIAEDAENWSVSWRLLPHSPPAADIRLAGTTPKDNENVFDVPGDLQNKLERTSPYSAETDLRVTILTEDEQDHPPGADVEVCSSAAPCRTTDATVCANVEAAQPPSLGTFFSATQGLLGLFDAIAELAAGWLQAIATPQSCYTLHVQYHQRCPGAPGGGAAALAAITSLDQLPCAYEGTATATYTESNMATELTTTVTASGLRFERDSLPLFDGVSYHAVAGQVSWTVSGSAIPDCTISGSGTYAANSNNASPDPWARDAHIWIWEEGGGAPRYEGQGLTTTATPMVLVSCSEVSFQAPAPDATSWFYAPEEGGFRLEADGSMKGSFAVGPDGERHAWEWDLHAAECQPSPEPVCQ